MKFWICLMVMWMSVTAEAADYHIDAEHGDDRNTGLSAQQAWKSLEPASKQTLQPRDRILLKCGTHYSGQLALSGSGTKSRPIEIGSYGEGNLPRIDGEGKSLDTLLLHNVDYCLVHDLEVTNHGDTTAPGRSGIHLECDDGQVHPDIRLDNLYVHDVNGDLHKEKEGCGIFFDCKGGASYDDLLIENCHIVHTDRNGLCQKSSGRMRSTHVILRNNLLEDIGGDGIKLWGTNGGLIEHNTVRGGRMRCDDYAAGIWPFSCDDTVIQFNEVSGMKGTKDGQGFDSDYICRHNIFQFNYSHNNDGGFMLICAPGTSYCQGTIVRYNISQNDGQPNSSIFHFGGNSSDTLVYNNVIYIGPDQKVPLLKFDDWSKGNAHHTSFFNNVFYVDGEATYSWGKSVDDIFDHNAFAGNHVNPPKDGHAITARVPLLKPGGGGDGFESLSTYKWTKDAPLGVLVPDNGGQDFFGHPVPLDHAPTVGVAQQ
jgi:hypothetical protein